MGRGIEALFEGAGAVPFPPKDQKSFKKIGKLKEVFHLASFF